MKLGYARVSTQEQSLELQKDLLIKEGVEPEYIFEEKVTGFS
ncbi:recombinase family protein [Pseudogracilibacillus sp. SE30717A]